MQSNLSLSNLVAENAFSPCHNKIRKYDRNVKKNLFTSYTIDSTVPRYVSTIDKQESKYSDGRRKSSLSD